jgi:hypothetical protein
MKERSGEHQRSLVNLLAEMALIAVGVFLGLLANNWHEEREHQTLADATLRNFAAEMRANQQSVEAHWQYHVTLAGDLEKFLKSKEPQTLDQLEKSAHFKGVEPVIFEHTAWDLALATQALSYLKPELAFDISKVYTQQNAFQTLENSFLASAFTPTTFASENMKGLATAMENYLVDVNIQEPAILQLYGKVIPEVNSALSQLPGSSGK